MVWSYDFLRDPQMNQKEKRKQIYLSPSVAVKSESFKLCKPWRPARFLFFRENCKALTSLKN
ncbi:hypothetical protein YC2023_082045 [Brassica napus]